MSYYVRVRDKPRHLGTPLLHVCVTVYYVRVGGQQMERRRHPLVRHMMGRTRMSVHPNGNGRSEPHAMRMWGSCNQTGSRHIWGQ